MTQQNDSIVLNADGEITAAEGAMEQPRTWQPTVRQVLSWLPANATPEQQDSIVQAHIKPCPITWSEQPDTLHLPGWPVGHSFRDVSLPKYYRESYFAGKPYFNPDLFGGRLGVAGDPVPYSIAGDNIITMLLLACFMLGTLAFTKSKDFMLRQARHFFRQSHGRPAAVSETGGELRFQLFLVLQSCLLIGLIYFFHVERHVASTFIIDQYQVIGVFSLLVMGYFAFKALAYHLSGWVFFPQPVRSVWMKSYLFILALEGMALFPIVMLQAYFNADVATTLVCAAAVVALFKVLTFYKTYVIFFKNRGGIVQNFLYFCTLELIPMAGLWGLLTMDYNYLKVNY